MSVRREPPLIHVVDDDEAVRSALALLAEASGWRISTFSSAEDYLARTPPPEQSPDCLVLDLQMPGTNGAELLERLQASRRRHFATIVLTAWPDSELARRALAAGASRILSKPFLPRDWLRVVEDSLPAA